MAVKPSYLILTGLGGVVAFAGIKGWALSGTLRDVLSGKSPSGQKQANPIAGATYSPTGLVGGAGVSAPGASELANLALEYIGFKYVYGGAPSSGATDCSGLVNMLRGWFQRKSIPGMPAGTYDGTSHGPNTVLWLAWNGCYRVPGGVKNARAGDLAVWQSHMGIIVQAGDDANTTMMVSDLNPSLGTQETSVAGAAPPGEILFIERFKN